MAAYLIVNLDVHDVDTFNEYRTRVPDFIAKHGGEYLVRAGEFEVLEGDWIGDRFVLFRFPDRVTIRNLFDDPGIRNLLPFESAPRDRTSLQLMELAKCKVSGATPQT